MIINKKIHNKLNVKSITLVEAREYRGPHSNKELSKRTSGIEQGTEYYSDFIP